MHISLNLSTMRITNPVLPGQNIRRLPTQSAVAKSENITKKTPRSQCKFVTQENAGDSQDLPVVTVVALVTMVTGMV